MEVHITVNVRFNYVLLFIQTHKKVVAPKGKELKT